jgi:hypothetical protein
LFFDYKPDFQRRVIWALLKDSQSRRWWRRHRNEPVNLFANPNPKLGGISFPFSPSSEDNFVDYDNDRVNENLPSLLKSKLVYPASSKSTPLSAIMTPCPINTDSLYKYIRFSFFFFL